MRCLPFRFPNISKVFKGNKKNTNVATTFRGQGTIRMTYNEFNSGATSQESGTSEPKSPVTGPQQDKDNGNLPTSDNLKPEGSVNNENNNEAEFFKQVIITDPDISKEPEILFPVHQVESLKSYQNENLQQTENEQGNADVENEENEKETSSNEEVILEPLPNDGTVENTNNSDNTYEPADPVTILQPKPDIEENEQSSDEEDEDPFQDDTKVDDDKTIDLDDQEVGKRANIQIFREKSIEILGDKDISYKKYEKDEESKALIKRALEANNFIKNMIDDERLNSMIEAMYPQENEAGSFIVEEGEQGSHLFISAHGNYQVIKNGEDIQMFGPGIAFGELAILYKAKRFASVKAIGNCKLWVLERSVFKKIMLFTRQQEQANNLKFLRSVPTLKGIQQTDLIKISDLLKRQFFAPGTVVIRQGERGNEFFIIRVGTVTITKKHIGKPEEFIGVLSEGQCFGEQALLFEDHRLATVTANSTGVECLVLDRKPFKRFLGDIEELKKRHEDPKPPYSKRSVVIKSEFSYIKKEELKVIADLGVGAFGRVELVEYTKDTTKLFALKRLKKQDIIEQRNEEHVYNEKEIMLRCNSPFVCKLYQTFRDNKYLYFLMEPVLGGDVWSVLQKKRYLEEKVARFMAACVVEALEHLHGMDIIYRDLKPENLMLDTNGYVKLVDFGCSKILTLGSKTDTYVGTPEYLAPELIKNEGHDRAVDYWALGIFVHELLVGKPPFRGQNTRRTLNLIVKGIEFVRFDPKISKVAQLIIKKLCRQIPIKRLGYAKNGIKDIKNHEWFIGINWNKLRARELPAPLVPSGNKLAKVVKEEDPQDETSGWDNEFGEMA